MPLETTRTAHFVSLRTQHSVHSTNSAATDVILLVWLTIHCELLLCVQNIQFQILQYFSFPARYFVLPSLTAELCFRWRLQSKMLIIVMGRWRIISASLHFFKVVLWVIRDKYIVKLNQLQELVKPAEYCTAARESSLLIHPVRIFADIMSTFCGSPDRIPSARPRTASVLCFVFSTSRPIKQQGGSEEGHTWKKIGGSASLRLSSWLPSVAECRPL